MNNIEFEFEIDTLFGLEEIEPIQSLDDFLQYTSNEQDTLEICDSLIKFQ